MNLSFISCNRQHGRGLSEKREAPVREEKQSACQKADYKLSMFAFMLLQRVIVIENLSVFVMVAYFICEVIR